MILTPLIISLLIGIIASITGYFLIALIGTNFWTLCVILYLYPITSFLVTFFLDKPQSEVLTS